MGIWCAVLSCIPLVFLVMIMLQFSWDRVHLLGHSIGQGHGGCSRDVQSTWLLLHRSGPNMTYQDPLISIPILILNNEKKIKIIHRTWAQDFLFHPSSVGPTLKDLGVTSVSVDTTAYKSPLNRINDSLLPASVEFLHGLPQREAYYSLLPLIQFLAKEKILAVLARIPQETFGRQVHQVRVPNTLI